MHRTDDQTHVPLDVETAMESLANCAIGHTLLRYDSIPSTMSVAQELAQQPESRSGTVVLAEEQSAGRGRLQRRWHAPPRQGLLLSIMLRPPHLPAAPAHLPMLAGLAAVRSLASLGLTPDVQSGLKWPNDILLARQRAQPRKMGGVLIESIFDADEWKAAVVGVGLNVNQLADDLPPVEGGALAPTSLRLEFGRIFDRTELLIAFCRAWEALATQPTAQLVNSWRSHLWTLGQWVALRNADGKTLRGVAVDVQDDGALVIEDSAGRRHAATTGDVTFGGEMT